MEDSNTILIYAFYDAPDELRNLSTNGGDEDWIAVLPPKYKSPNTPTYLEEGRSFGCFCVSVYPHPTKEGWEVRIGCHA